MPDLPLSLHHYPNYPWLRGFNIILSWAARRGFHAWFTSNGQPREGLDFLREPPRFKAPWL